MYGGGRTLLICREGLVGEAFREYIVELEDIIVCFTARWDTGFGPKVMLCDLRVLYTTLSPA